MPTDRERIRQPNAVLKHLRQLMTDTGQLINALQRERDLSRAIGTITSVRNARNRITSRPHRTADKR
jgi:hypothetical protein